MHTSVLAALIVATGLLPVAPTRAADDGPIFEKLSLEGAIRQAVASNAVLRRAEAEVRNGNGLLLSAEGIYDIDIEVGGSLSRRVTPALSPDDLTAGVSDQKSYRLELGRRLETGGKLTLGLSGAVGSSNSPFECGSILATDRCVVHTLGGAVAITQPLLRGFGPAVSSAEIHRQAAQRDIATTSRLASAALVVRDVVIAYAQLAHAHEVLAIQRGALELARDQLRNTERQVSVGKRAPIDAAAAHQATGTSELLVLAAEEDVFTRTLALREVIGIDNPLPMTLIVAEPLTAVEPPALEEAILVERAQAGNLQLQALKLGRKLSDTEMDVARSLLLPRLDLEASLGTVGRSAELDQAYTQVSSWRNRGWFAGLTFALPVQDRVGRGQVASARALRAEVEVSVEAASRDIRNQVLRLVNAIRSGKRRLELARQTDAFAEMNLRAEKARFALGQSTSNDVLRVQQDLRQAHLTVVSASLALTTDRSSLAALTGEILDQYKIALRQVE